MCCVRGVGVQGLTMTHSQQNSCLHTFISPHHLIIFLSLTPQGIALAKICPMVPSTPPPAPVKIPDNPLFYPSCIPLRDLQDLFRALRRSPTHWAGCLWAPIRVAADFVGVLGTVCGGPAPCRDRAVLPRVTSPRSVLPTQL